MGRLDVGLKLLWVSNMSRAEIENREQGQPIKYKPHEKESFHLSYIIPT